MAIHEHGVNGHALRKAVLSLVWPVRPGVLVEYYLFRRIIVVAHVAALPGSSVTIPRAVHGCFKPVGDRRIGVRRRLYILFACVPKQQLSLNIRIFQAPYSFLLLHEVA